MGAEPARILARGEGYGIYAWESMLLNVFDHGAANLEGMVAMRDASRDFHRAHSKFPSVTVLRGELSMRIPQEVRDISMEIARESADMISATVIVVPTTGLKSAFYRSIITAAQMVQRSKAPQRTSTSFEDAITWICSLEGQPGGITGRAADAMVAFGPYVIDSPAVN